MPEAGQVCRPLIVTLELNLVQIYFLFAVTINSTLIGVPIVSKKMVMPGMSKTFQFRLRSSQRLRSGLCARRLSSSDTPWSLSLCTGTMSCPVISARESASGSVNEENLSGNRPACQSCSAHLLSVQLVHIQCCSCSIWTLLEHGLGAPISSVCCL